VSEEEKRREESQSQKEHFLEESRGVLPKEGEEDSNHAGWGEKRDFQTLR